MLPLFRRILIAGVFASALIAFPGCEHRGPSNVTVSTHGGGTATFGSRLHFVAVIDEDELGPHAPLRVLAAIGVFEASEDVRANPLLLNSGFTPDDRARSQLSVMWRGTELKLQVDGDGNVVDAEDVAAAASLSSGGRYFLLVDSDQPLRLSKSEEDAFWSRLISTIASRATDPGGVESILLAAEERRDE